MPPFRATEQCPTRETRDARLIELWNDGVTVEKIALDLGISISTVDQDRKRLGLTREKRLRSTGGVGYRLGKVERVKRKLPSPCVAQSDFIRPLTKAELMRGK